MAKEAKHICPTCGKAYKYPAGLWKHLGGKARTGCPTTRPKEISREELQQDLEDPVIEEVSEAPTDPSEDPVEWHSIQEHKAQLFTGEAKETLETAHSEMLENWGGGPIWLFILSVGEVLQFITGEEHYISKLKIVEPQIKQALWELGGDMLENVPPGWRVALLVAIAWIPLMIMDIPAFVEKGREIYKAVKKLKKEA
jgi:hypothetical protein